MKHLLIALLKNIFNDNKTIRLQKKIVKSTRKLLVLWKCGLRNNVQLPTLVVTTDENELNSIDIYRKNRRSVKWAVQYTVIRVSENNATIEH